MTPTKNPKLYDEKSASVPQPLRNDLESTKFGMSLLVNFTVEDYSTYGRENTDYEDESSTKVCDFPNRKKE